MIMDVFRHLYECSIRTSLVTSENIAVQQLTRSTKIPMYRRYSRYAIMIHLHVRMMADQPAGERQIDLIIQYAFAFLWNHLMAC
jgi:hypothetical protein